MTKEAALQSFWSSFGLTAYEENAVPDNAVLPYITYGVSVGSFVDNGIPVSASLWYKSPWSVINAKAREVSDYIGAGGTIIECDGGAVWITRGNPFSQNMMDDSDSSVRRKYINISIEYLTED